MIRRPPNDSHLRPALHAATSGVTKQDYRHSSPLRITTQRQNSLIMWPSTPQHHTRDAASYSTRTHAPPEDEAGTAHPHEHGTNEINTTTLSPRRLTTTQLLRHAPPLSPAIPRYHHKHHHLVNASSPPHNTFGAASTKRLPPQDTAFRLHPNIHSLSLRFLYSSPSIADPPLLPPPPIHHLQPTNSLLLHLRRMGRGEGAVSTSSPSIPLPHYPAM